MDSDVLHNFVCSYCKKNTMEFGSIMRVCPHCNSSGTISLRDFSSTVSTTVGQYDVQYDSIDSLDEDVATEVERVELDKDLVEMEKARRGEGISSEQQ